jgi:hypothetical protein
MVIVGVVGNISLGNLRYEQAPIAFVPPQSNGVNFAAPNILIGTTRSVESTGAAVRAILAEGGREYAQRDHHRRRPLRARTGQRAHDGHARRDDGSARDPPRRDRHPQRARLLRLAADARNRCVASRSAPIP